MMILGCMVPEDPAAAGDSGIFLYDRKVPFLSNKKYDYAHSRERYILSGGTCNRCERCMKEKQVLRNESSACLLYMEKCC